MSDWYAPLRGLASLGATVDRPGGLAGLHAARQRTLGQFFTPDPVASLVWSIVQPAMDAVSERQISLLDNSCGSGRLFQFAHPERHQLYGIEVHQPCADAVAAVIEKAGFRGAIVQAEMEACRISGCDIGLINPPFNLLIDAPHAEPFPSGNYGIYGPASAHRSHRYALEQARGACDIVVAIMPSTFCTEVLTDARGMEGLHAIYHLPAGAFRSAGTEVATGILVYGPHPPERSRVMALADLSIPAEHLPSLALPPRRWSAPSITRTEITDDQPVITTPVTGDRSVRIYRSGRRLRLRFACGVAEAQVMNDLLGSWAFDRGGRDERLPSSIRHTGQGVFDLANYLMQEQPGAALVALERRLRNLDCQPRLNPGLVSWLMKTHQRQRRACTPLRKSIFLPGDPETGREPGWTLRHPGVSVAYPHLAQAVASRARTLGIDRWLDRPYQFQDLVELVTHGGGAVVAWEMGLGKARLAVALCLLGGRRNLLVVEPRLLDEMRTELRGLPLDPGTWQIIEGPDDLACLRQVNVISYTTLKRAPAGLPRQTIARQLRHRIHTCICDEGHCLRNPDSDQSRAVLHLSAKVSYVLSGTPIANYPRDILPILRWVAGDGTPRQPFGIHHPYLEQRSLADSGRCRRGLDRFRQMFVTTEWITNEFADDLRSGAKREIPKIAQIEPFRALLAPSVKRRVLEEPDVAACVHIPIPTVSTRTIPWDIPHLRFYHRVSQQFVHWFRNQPEWQRRKGANLVAVLAKIQGVMTACNHPQAGVLEVGAHAALTSKQRYALDRLERLCRTGHKTILFAHSPGLLDLLHGHLAQRGITAVRFHGGIPIAQRVADLDRRFRQGDAPVLLASIGACQTGYNIHQADRVILYDRDWAPKSEQQACARVLRPQQSRQVEIEYLHLEGSIDCYQAQMIEHKASAIRSGLDEGEDDTDAGAFLHLDTILGRFVEDIEARLGVNLSRKEAICA